MLAGSSSKCIVMSEKFSGLVQFVHKKGFDSPRAGTGIAKKRPPYTAKQRFRQPTNAENPGDSAERRAEGYARKT